MMKQHYKLLALPLLTSFALLPAIANADDTLGDLDATMIVVDSPSDLNDAISEIQKPSKRGVSSEDWEDEEGDTGDGESDQDEPIEQQDDARDDDFDRDREDLEDVLELDDDFEDGDEIDDDLADDDEVETPASE